MDSSGRHKFCHSLISSSTVNQSFVFTTAFSTSPFFSLALGLRLGRCRSAPSPSLLFLFLFLLSRSVTSVGLLRLLLVAFLGRLDIFCQNLDLVGDGGLEARCLRPPLKPSSNLGVWKKNVLCSRGPVPDEIFQVQGKPDWNLQFRNEAPVLY